MISNFPSLFIALRYLKPSKNNTMVSIISLFSFLGIVLGVGTLIIVMSVMNGFKIELLDKIIGINGHLNIHFYNKDFNESQFENFLNSNNDVKVFRKIIDGQGLLAANKQSTGIIIKGINKNDFIDLKNDKKKMEISKKFNFENNSVIVGVKLMERLNLQIGDKFKLIIPKISSTPFGNIPKVKTFTIGGYFDSGMYTYDNNLVFISFFDANKLFLTNENKPYFQLEFYDINSIDNFKEKLSKTNLSNYQLYDWRFSNEAFFNAIQTEKNVMFLILSLIILVAAFNIISSLIMLVKNKQIDIAILRTMGASQSTIMKIFFLNGAVIGFFGTLIGTFFGIFFVLNINTLKNFLENFTNTELFSSEIYFLSNLPAKIDHNEVSYVVLISLLICFIASFLPAWMASKNNPIDLIRKE
jgi:lipoprotein-releasing system permease protein